MIQNKIEGLLTKFILIGIPLASITVFTSGVNDPVNVTKMFVLGCVAIPMGFLIISRGLRYLMDQYRAQVVICAVFLIAMLNSIVFGESPFSQNLYGVFGRNTGFLTYFSFLIVFVSALFITSRKNFIAIVFSFMVVGVVNVVYCGWVIVFGDPIGWVNPYKQILGLLGNPNFIGAFLGMLVVTLVAYSLKGKHSISSLFGLACLGLITLIEIRASNAIQGVVVCVGGVTIVLLLKTYYTIKRKSLIIIALLPVVSVGALFIAGALQRGPFDFVYKRSVSFRGTYWKTAIDMALQRPYSGVGMDSYGDFYRQSRPPIALVDTPGIQTGSNSAHNVFLDFFSYGGWPLFISYIAIVSLGLVAFTKALLHSQEFDWVLVAIGATWLGYQVQSVISINQIGLAVWGWLFTGLLVSYERLLKRQNVIEKKSSRVKSTSFSASNPLIVVTGLVVGFLVYLPPLNADMKWHSAVESGRAELVEEALIPGYFNPESTWKYTNAFQLFVNSNLHDQATRYAAQSVKYNPNSFESWKAVYYSKYSTKSQKILALKNMKKLDPLNPEVEKY